MFNDDEQPIVPASNEGKLLAVSFSDAGNASVYANHSKEAPLDTTTIRVLLGVSSSSSTVTRAPLDLVVVLDVSDSMRDGGKLEQLKPGMDFLAKKLQPMDRLSIVTFSSAATATMLCRLRAMSESAKSGLKGIVDGLQVATTSSGGANTMAGLQTALQVHDGRQHTAGRTAEILLISGGQQSRGDDGRQAVIRNPGNLPIHVVAFGSSTTADDIEQLRDLATMNGGTFNLVVDNGGADKLPAFSNVVAGLLTVVAPDLHLILSKPTSPDNDLDTILKVDSQDFKQETDDQSCTVTVKFGDLFNGEAHQVVVDLLLVDYANDELGGDSDDYKADILSIAVSYPDAQGKRQKYRANTVHMKRTASTGRVTKGTAPQIPAARTKAAFSHYYRNGV